MGFDIDKALPNPVAPVMIYLGGSLDQKHPYFSIRVNVDKIDLSRVTLKR